ncbi:MAG: hypothetical protein ACKVQR_20925 [Aquabacterium sp.]
MRKPTAFTRRMMATGLAWAALLGTSLAEAGPPIAAGAGRDRPGAAARPTGLIPVSTVLAAPTAARPAAVRPTSPTPAAPAADDAAYWRHHASS